MKKGQYSTTALLIAKAHVFLSTDPDYKNWVSSDALNWSLRFIEVATGDKKYDRRCKNPFYRFFINSYERIVLPGIIRHYLHRKKCIEKKTVELIENGEVNRIVVLAGGFDTLALRLASKYPDLNFIEMDHPDTQEVKVKAVGADCPDNLEFKPVNYQETTLGEILDQENQGKTLFIAEGLLMYLPENVVKSMFQSIADHSTDQSSFIFTYTHTELIPEKSLVNLWLSLKKEEFHWSVTDEEVIEFLKEVSPKSEVLATNKKFQNDLHEQFDKKLTSVLGERICFAKL